MTRCIGNRTDDDDLAVQTDTRPLVFTNVTVAVADWAADTTYAGYGYAASIALTGVLATMQPFVTFSPADVKTMATVANTTAGHVTIYASAVPSATITIPAITLWRTA